MVDRLRTGMLALLAIAALFAAPLGVGQPAEAQSGPRIAAVVGEDAITLGQLENRLALAILSAGVENDLETRRRLAPQVLRGLIDERLQLQEAERLGVAVAPGELERAIGDVARQNGVDAQRLIALLRSRGIDERTLTEQLRAQIAWLKTIDRRFGDRAEPTSAQIELEIETMRRRSREPAFAISEIVLPIYDPAEEPEVRRNAVEIVDALRAGANFDALARQISRGPTAAAGGDRGWVRAADFDAETRARLDVASPGSLVGPLRTAQGVALYWLRDKRTASDGIGGVRELRLAQLFLPANDEASRAEARRTAIEARAGLDGCADVIAAAERRGLGGSGDMGWIAPADLPPTLAEPLLELENGELSRPLDGPGGVHLIMICDRREQGLDELRRAVAERLENEQLERLAERYLRELRRAAFVEVRL